VSRAARLAPPLLVAALAAVVLGWNLGGRYLWQDEAQTAILARRLLEHGRPLAWDGRNLLTMDFLTPAEALSTGRWSGDAEAALRFYRERGDFKPDGAWIGAPWGQFALAAAGLFAFGEGTWQARVPFAAAGVLCALLLFELARRRLGPAVGALAVLLLLGNVFWLLHTRQCRYYAASSLPLLAWLALHLGWRAAAPGAAELRAAAAAAAAGWCLFQVDFGLFWPALGVLAADALASPPRARSRLRALLPAAAALAAVAPWVWYYELAGRHQATFVPRAAVALGTLFALNQFLVPLVLVPPLAWLVWREARAGRVEAARLAGLCLALPLALAVWVSGVAPMPYHRYLVAATPAAALALAFGLQRGAALVFPDERRLALAAAAALAVFLSLSPVISNAVSALLPLSHVRRWGFGRELGTWLRPELRSAWIEIAGDAPDPNRAVVEFLRPRVGPDDEILTNYEDLPLIFYLPVRVRGGIASFRVEDRSAEPRYAAMRRSVGFVDAKVYNRELARHRWKRHVLDAPDIPFGNSPDPSHRFFPLVPNQTPIAVLERLGPGKGEAD
jgi:hypothetical protein